MLFEKLNEDWCIQQSKLGSTYYPPVPGIQITRSDMDPETKDRFGIHHGDGVHEYFDTEAEVMARLNQLVDERYKPQKKKVYLGDGVYATKDVRGIVLTTENGVQTSNTIVLEPEVLRAFCEWAGLEKKNER